MGNGDKGHTIPPYEPPYESPIEDWLAWSLAKYLNSTASLDKQYEVDTICGRFRLDFVVTSKDGYHVGYECDGADYHDEWRDEWRDAMILGGGLLDTIVRFKGRDIAYHLDDIVYVASCWDPVLFSDRGRSNLNTLASREARAFGRKRNPYRASVAYREGYEGNRPRDPLLVVVQRRCRVDVSGWRQFWRNLYSYAEVFGGGDLDEIIAAYHAERFGD